MDLSKSESSLEKFLIQFQISNEKCSNSLNHFTI